MATTRTTSPWTTTNPAPLDPDFMRADRMPAVTEVFNDRAQAVRRAKWLGWLVLPVCPMSGKHGVMHPDYLASWRSKVNAKRRTVPHTPGVPFSPVSYGF